MDERLLWLVPGLVLGLGFWRPRVGLLVLAATLPLFGTPPGGPYLAQLDMAGLCALVVGARARWIRRHSSTHGPRDPLSVALVAWVLSALVSALPLAYAPPSWRPALLAPLIRTLPHVLASELLFSWRAIFQLLVGAGIFWSVRVAFRGRSIRPLALALAGGVGCLVVLGIAEQASLVDLSFYRSIGAEIFDLRLHSLFFHSGWLAQYLVVATPFAAAGLLAGGTWSRRAGFALVGLTLVALLFTQQRGAWIAAASQLALGLVVLGRRILFQRRTLLVGLLLVATVLAGVVVIVSTDSTLASSIGSRLDPRALDLSGRARVWERSLNASSKTGFVGSGIGTFGAEYGRLYPCVEGGHCWLTAHNTYVHTLFERGLPGLLALAMVVIAAATLLRRAISRPQSSSSGKLAFGLALSLAGAAVYGLVQYLFFLESIEWLLWMLFAAATLVAPTVSVRRRWLALAAVVVALALVAVPLRRAASASTKDPAQATYGLHSPETKSDGSVVRWTTAHAARRIPWESDLLVVELVDGHPLASERNLEVTISLDGRVAWHGPVGAAWQEIPIDTGPRLAPTLVLGIHASPSFRPWSDYRRHPELQQTRDFRSLGVATRRVYWRGLELQKTRLRVDASYASPYWITLGNLGDGPFVVAPPGRLELESPLVVFTRGFKVLGELEVSHPPD